MSVRVALEEGIPPEIRRTIELAAKYMADETTDWVTIKRMLLLVLSPKFRKVFSTRDPKTKEQQLNDLERLLIGYWFKLTGKVLVLDSQRVGKGRQ